MPKVKDGEEEEVKEWDASQPFEDEKEELEANTRARRAARVDHLKKKFSKELEEKDSKGRKKTVSVPWD